MRKQSFKSLHIYLDQLATKLKPVVPEKLFIQLEEEFSLLKLEFSVAKPNSHQWSKERRAEAEERKKSRQFWVRDKLGKVTEFKGIENLSKFLNLKSSTVYHYLSTNGGTVDIRSYQVSRTQLLELTSDADDSWAKEYFDKHGIWPQPEDAPSSVKGRY